MVGEYLQLFVLSLTESHPLLRKDLLPNRSSANVYWTSQILWFDAFVLFLAATGHFLVSPSATRQLLIVNQDIFEYKLILSCRDSEQAMPQSLHCCQLSLR